MASYLMEVTHLEGIQHLLDRLGRSYRASDHILDPAIRNITRDHIAPKAYQSPALLT